MQIIRAPRGLSNTKLISYDDFHKKMSIHGHNVQIRCKEIYKKLDTHPIFIDFAESNPARWKQSRSYHDGTYASLEPKDTYIKERINSLIKENPIKYKGPKDNNLLEYLSNLLLYKALLLDIMEQLKDELGNNKDLKQTCADLDYILSIHIRFTRSMSALNRYTDEAFTQYYAYRISNYQNGQADLFFRIIKQKNLMKLRRSKINRYVTVHHGGIYTTVTSDPHERKHERTKFGIAEKDKQKGKWDLKDAKLYGAKPTPIWDHSSPENENDTLEERIKKSCNTFNASIEKSVISTYANYYGVNNILEVQNGKLYLNYDGSSGELTIPTYKEVTPENTKIAPLHVRIDVPAYMDKIPSEIESLTYKPCPKSERAGTGTCYDLYGLLYTIRKGQIAVQFNGKKAGFHSTMWSGKAVQAAGSLCTWNGKIIAVDNASGHYQPNWYLLYKAWEPFYEKNVFYNQGIVGMWTRWSGKDYIQFFKADIFFKELANNNFPIGLTVTKLEEYFNELKQKRELEVIDQQDKTDCVDVDVFQSPHLAQFHHMLNIEQDTKGLAEAFIISMEYDWEEIIKNVKKSYNNFPAKKTIWSGLRSRFNVIPNDNRVENILKRRTKRLRKDIKNRHKKNNYYYVSGMDEINQKNIPLIQLIDAYKKIGFELIPKITWENEFVKEIEDFRKEQKEKIKEEPKTVEWAAYEQSKLEEKRNKFDQIISSNDVLKEKWRIKVNKYMIEKIGIGLLFKLIKCMVDINPTNEAFSSFKNVLNNVEKGRIENWSKNIKKALEVPANKRAGLDTSKEVILLNAAEQKNKAEEYIKTPDIVCSAWPDISIDNLSNLGLTDEDTTIVKNKLRLVDKRIYEQQQPKKSQSTTAKEGVWLYCDRCGSDFKPTRWQSLGEPKLAVGSNCPNCHGYNSIKEKPLKDQEK